MRYIFNLGSIVIPDGWTDRSILSFVEDSAAGPPTSSVVLHYEYISPETAMENFADQQLVAAAQRLPGFTLKTRRPGTVQGYRSIEMFYEWRTPEQIHVTQRQAYLAIRPGTLMVITMTNKTAESNKIDEKWRDLLASFRTGHV